MIDNDVQLITARAVLATTGARAALWVERTFGTPILNDRKERAERILEEAIELAQAEGVEIERVRCIVNRVYLRPVGDVEQEVAGVFHTLLVYANVTGVDLISIVLKEMDRVESIPVEHFRRKLKEKFISGCTSYPYAQDDIEP